MFEFLRSRRRVVELHGCPINLDDVEAALLEDPAVEACAVLIRTGDRPDSEPELIPYLAAADTLSLERVRSRLQSILPAALLPTTYVPISTLPLTPEGGVDEAALARLEVIDAEVIRQWEACLTDLPEVEQAAVRIDNSIQRQSLLHISDLLPDWKAISGSSIDGSITRLQHATTEESAPGRLAISQGEPLRNPEQLPETLPAALKRAAQASPDKGVVYIQSDDSDIFQPYPALLDKAQRILSGLRQLGLKPQDTVIFQLPNNQDFISTFWGCLLGGFVPVPLEVIPTHQASHSAVKKLRNVWQMLDHPLIVASQELQTAIQSSFAPGDRASIQLATVETLTGYSPDTDWHEGNPDDLALLLLTSGSTGLPKGVMLSHCLILYRAAIAAQRHQMDRESVSINWLPLDHVSGIAQFHVRDIYLGCQQVHAPTEAFLQDPLKWLDWIERFRTHITWAPNFAYGLVNNQANRILSQQWDLSSMGIFLNAGEAIAPQTARRFMELLTPHGLPATAMHPAWGMSETAGAVVYSDQYSLAVDDSQFVETGSPGPDLSVRIVDSQNQVVTEEVIGALQIKGPMVISGYYQNPEANQAAFTEDGWFNTGDLGFIREGRVTITGRRKDVIIINGVNYYCHEIEAIVEAIEGIGVSYTAACGVRTANSDTDQLTIFFHPETADDSELLELLTQIRGSVVKNVGVNPTYLLPVEPSVIPKTGIGKIQRSQLKQRLESGEFDAILKRIDLLSRNANTLPDWFYQPSWRRKAIERWRTLQHWRETCLIFLDSSGLGAAICSELDTVDQLCIKVEMGERFVQKCSTRYQIDPQNPDHYQQLWACLNTDKIQIDRVIHLWTYGNSPEEVNSAESLERAQAQGLCSVLVLVQALEQTPTPEAPVRLLVVSSQAQAAAPEDAISPEKSPLLGLLKTIPQEMPGLQCSHLDLQIDSAEVNAGYVLQELWTDAVDPEVAYRQGKRLVSRLEPVKLSQEKPQNLPFKQGGMYLITGGLGDLGAEIAAYLLQHCQAKVLLVGRTSLPERETWPSHLTQTSPLSQKIQAYFNLEKLGGDVSYAAVDVCDFPQLQQTVTQAAAGWGCELDGIIHLAGLYQERSLMDETPKTLAQALRPQVMGAWRLPQLLPDNSKGLFISFASVNGLLGGFKVGAFAAASRFLSSFADYQRQRGLQSYCIAWSLWNDLGISRGYPLRKLARDRGYYTIHRQQGLYSFLAGLHHNCSQLLVGIDGDNPRIRRYVEMASSQTQRLCAYLASCKPQVASSTLQALAVNDRFGQQTTCEFHQVQAIPAEKKTGNRVPFSDDQLERLTPSNDLARQIAGIWQTILGISDIGIHDNFFELGGHSLLATQLVARLREDFGVEVSLSILLESPTVAELGEVITEFRTQPHSLLGSSLDAPKITPAPADLNEPFPLNGIQQAYWLGRDPGFELGNVATHVYGEIDCSGLDLDRLNQGLQRLIDHHPMLRAIVLPDGRQQILAETPPYELTVADLSALNNPQQAQQLTAIRDELSHQVLSPEQWPLFELRATKLGNNKTRLHLSLDLLIADASSLQVLGQQLLRLYFHPGDELPPLKLSFRDYVLAEQALQTREEYLRAEHYWFDRLDSLPAAPELPLAMHSSQIEQPRFRRRRYRLAPEQWQALQNQGQRLGLTPSGILLAAFADVLSLWSRRAHFTLNLTTFNRLPLHPEVNEIVGDFTSLTLVEVDFRQPCPFGTRAQQLQRQLFEGLDHRYCSGVQVLREHARRHGNKGQAVMPVVFTSLLSLPQSAEGSAQEAMRQLGEVVYTLSQTPQVWLDQVVFEEQAALVCCWDAVEAIFPTGMLDAMFASYCDWLTQLATDESAWRQVRREHLLPKDQQQQRRAINTTQVPVSEALLHSLFTDQVSQRDQNPAVITPERSLSYGELSQLARQLAHHLRQQGAKPNTLAAVVLEKDWRQVVAVLGVLMSGAAYVPIDPTLPAQRQQQLLEQSQAQWVVATWDWLESFEVSDAYQALALDDILAQPQATLPPLTWVQQPEDLAYVIYTSGSTGTPKGVAIDHRGAVNTLLDINRRFAVGPEDRIFALSALNFDLSVYDIFGVLAAGGVIVMPEADQIKEPSHWVDLMQQHRVTLWDTVPALAQMLADYLSGEGKVAPSRLRLALLSGDWLPLGLPVQLRRLWPEMTVVSLGGATEASIWSIAYPITTVDPHWTSIPYGKPLANQSFAILNDQFEPCPVWVPGDLYIGGIGLAQSYWQDQARTAASFILHPVSGERLYKTGDLGRYLPDGNIEFLGREDFQIKLRGFRIELGEIESALNQHPTVKQTVVATVGEAPNHQLAAYIVPSDATVDIEELRRLVRSQLPDYMVPAFFISLEKVPLTANGKVDRKALPIPADDFSRTTEFVPPRTVEESLLAEIWADTLKVEQVGVYDNFFALGGDSLLSVQALIQAQQSGLSFTVKQLFQHPTIETLVTVLNQHESSPQPSLTTPFSLIDDSQRQFIPAGVEDAYPLTKLQLGMLFHSQYAPETAAYHNISSYHLRAPLDIPTLTSAIESIMARHPVLRTSFHLSEFEQPLQLVHQQVTPQLSVDDLQGLSTDEQEEAIATWIEQEKQNPFNFQKAPLIRFHLHQRSENSFNLTLTKHHAILDGWSVAILMTELCQQYLLLLDESFAQNVSLLSPVPSFTLRDFIAQEQALLGNKTAQQYWRHTLADLTVTQLPRWPDRDTNHTPAAIGVQPIELAPSLTQALKELARTAGVPLKTVLLTAHLRVISWLSNQTDVTTGLVSNGRPAIAGSDRVMGLFFNTMPLRLQLTRGSWLELVRQTFAAEREALPFQSYPLAELQQTIVDGQPLFETVFNYINFHEFQRLSGLDALELISGQFFERSHFALVAQASVNLVTHELEFHLRYDLSEFTAEQISAMAQYYQAVLNAMSSQPNASYEKVCLLTSAERRRLLVEWNDTQTEYPHDQCIHQLVETQVERTPDAIAALFEDERLSYRELNARANQVAHYLQSLGVGPEVLVGICVERSIEMLVGLLGILKAGGAYVPLDPGFPQQRLQFMLADAQISVLLTQERLLAALPELKAQVVSLDRDWSAIAQASPKNLDSDVTAENLAYVIYTSGSTGTPKGVQVQHQSVVNFLTSMQVSPGLQSTDRLAAVTTLSFDIAALELYLPLITGAAVAIMPLAVTKDGHQLKAQLNSTQATVMQATPATWQMLLDAGWSSASTPMTLLCGGEALSYELSCQLLASGQKLWNLYGPTETTIWSTRFCAERSSSKKEQYSKQPIAIGRPIANTQLYILDSYLQPVPIGVAGELHIGGAGLARGYLNRPELTAGKFIVSPFVEGESQQSEASSQQSSSSSPSPLPASSRPRVSASLPGARLYKTGDLARYLPDGNIEFLGRIDHQVKIRGFRIELGEIEAALAQHPAVQQSVAIVREDVFDGKRLIAYIIPTQNQALTIDELRRFLKQQLPKYMMPEVFMLLDSLPLTPNGKVDRRALPAPDLSRSDLSNPFVAPRTVVEQQLADIWAEVLNIEKVGIHDNFFDLGGHSLLATQVASRVRQVFSTEFPLATLFESPTLAELSEFIEMLRWVGSSQDCSDDNTDDYLEEAI